MNDMCVMIPDGPISRTLLLPSLHSVGVNGSSCDDVVHFDFFRRRTSPMAGALFPSDFWRRCVLQVAHAEPAVWNAAAALGALHRRWEIWMTMAYYDSSQATQEYGIVSNDWAEGERGFATRAAECYGKALQLARNVRTPAATLVLGLTLGAVANLAGRWVDARVHVTSGRKIIAQIKTAGYLTVNAEIDCASESLAHMELQGMTFSEASAPYPYLESDLPDRGGATINSAPHLPAEIENLNQATTHFLDLFSQLMLLHGRGSAFQDPASAYRIAQGFVAWEMAMIRYLETSKGRAESLEAKERIALLSLKLYHAIARAMLRGGASGPPTRWDACLAHYERIIHICSVILSLQPSVSQAVVSFDMGLVMPLYSTATRCRHPLVRRYALTLLRRSNRHEGRWQSLAAAAVATKIATLEEAGLGIEAPMQAYLRVSQEREWADAAHREEPRHWLRGDEGWQAQQTWEGVPLVPEERRFEDVLVTADTDAKAAILSLGRFSASGNELPRVGPIRVHFSEA